MARSDVLEPNLAMAPSAGSGVTRGSLLKGIVVFGGPLVFAMALGALFNLVDLWVVARMADPEVAVAAVSIPSLVNSIPMIIFNGIVNAMIALVARHHGLGNHGRANLAAGQAIVLTILLSIVFGVPPWIYAEEIVVACGAEGAVVEPATDNLAIMSAGTFTMFLLMTVTGALRAVGNSWIPVVLLVGSNVLNIVLDIWFVFGGLGVPAMGVAGAAWATVISRALAAAGGILALWVGVERLRLRGFAWHGRTIWTVLRIGVPSCLQWLVRMLAYLYVMRFVAEAAPKAGEVVEAAQAAYGVGLRLDTLALFSGFGWGAAAATFVGQNLGRGLRDRAIRASWISLGLNMAMMVLFAACYVLFAEALLGVMGFDTAKDDTGAVIRIGRTYLYCASSGFVFLAVAIVISQALAGAGATKFPFALEVLAYGAIGYPFTGWVASHAAEWGLRALWLSSVAIHLAVAIAYVLWFRFGSWSKKELR
jgi:putative MATE family efflux protein